MVELQKIRPSALDIVPWSNVYSYIMNDEETMEETVMAPLTIGKMSKMAGVTNDTVRFYERCGLIEPAGRSASNYRLYHAEDAGRLRFIKRAKELGFSLNEIKDLLALSQNPHASKADVKARTEVKAEKIRQNIHDLTRILKALEQLNEMCNGHGSAHDCPILQALNND